MTIGNLSENSLQAGQLPSNSNKTKQYNGPEATILQGQKASQEIFFELRGTLRVQTLAWKFLLSKLVHEGFESLNGEEIHSLFLLHDRLSTVKDRGWVDKYFNWFGNSVIMFDYFTRYLEEGCPESEKGKKTWDPFLVCGFTFTACAYFGRRTFFNVKNVLKRVNLKLRRKPRPKNRIGVGYRDHGTARNVATDGSPSWQEVASVALPSSGTTPQEETDFRIYLSKIQGRRIQDQFFSQTWPPDSV